MQKKAVLKYRRAAGSAATKRNNRPKGTAVQTGEKRVSIMVLVLAGFVGLWIGLHEQDWIRAHTEKIADRIIAFF